MTPERFLIRRRDRRRGEGGMSTPRFRRVAGATLLFLLATGILFTQCTRQHDGPVVRVRPASTTTAVHTADTSGLRRLVPGSDQCSDVPGPTPELRCWIDNVSVDYRLLGIPSALPTYQAKIGDLAPEERSGPPACASGHPEERAWSRPGLPLAAAGRYRCTIVSGRAEMWWMNMREGLLAHAIALDDDLGRLFAWWRARPEHDGSSGDGGGTGP
jgi:hypothetical protein